MFACFTVASIHHEFALCISQRFSFMDGRVVFITPQKWWVYQSQWSPYTLLLFSLHIKLLFLPPFPPKKKLRASVFLSFSCDFNNNNNSFVFFFFLFWSLSSVKEGDCVWYLRKTKIDKFKFRTTEVLMSDRCTESNINWTGEWNDYMESLKMLELAHFLGSFNIRGVVCCHPYSNMEDNRPLEGCQAAVYVMIS